MPKQKTHKGLRKRITVTARGKLIRRRMGANKLMSGKSGRRKQRLRRLVPIEGALAKKAAEALAV